jgi:hypothetical protein
MTGLISLATILSQGLVLVSTREMPAQGNETVGSSAAKGFEVKGVANNPPSGNYFNVAMQEGARVYVCEGDKLSETPCYDPVK